MKKKNAVALGLFLTMAMSMPASAIDCSNAHRIDGSDRVKTSLESAKMVESKVLVLASGYSYADSLSASNVVLKTGGKLVLVGEKTDVAALLKGNNYEKIYIVGGEKTLPKSVEESAKKLSKNVIRLSGANRYGTNEKTLSEFKINDVGVADGGNYPDALSASALLKDKNLGLLLVNGVKPYKTNHNVKYTFGYSVKQDAGKRLAGRDRYATNLAVLNELGRKDNIAIASGEKFPDALSAINVVTAKDASVVLVRNNTNNISKDLNDYIEKAKDAYILGGTSTISKDVAKFLICENKTETPSYSGGGGGGGSHSSSRPAVDTVEKDFDKELNSALENIKLPADVASITLNGDSHTKVINVLNPDEKISNLKNTNAMVALDKLIKDNFEGYELYSYQIIGKHKQVKKENGKDVMVDGKPVMEEVNYPERKFEGVKNSNEAEAAKALDTLKRQIIDDFAAFVELDSENLDLTLGKFLEDGKNEISANVVLKKKGTENEFKNYTYTAKFVGGNEAIENDFNVSLSDAINSANIPEDVATYKYEDKHATVYVNNKEADITTLHETGLAASLENLVNKHNLNSYKIEGMTKEMYKDDPTVNEEGYRVVKDMDSTTLRRKVIDDFTKVLEPKDENALKLGNLVGETLRADVRLDSTEDGKTIDAGKYSVTFVDNQAKFEQEVKDAFHDNLGDALKGINLPEGVAKFEDGFEEKDGEYIKNVVIENPETPVTSIKGTNAMVELKKLINNVGEDGFKLVSYKIGEQETVNLNPDDPALSGRILDSFVKELKMTKADAKLGDFGDKTISADVTLKKGDREINVKYGVHFNLNSDIIYNNFNDELANIIGGNRINLPKGVKDISYDKDKRIATVTLEANANSIGDISGTNAIVELENLINNKFLESYEILGNKTVKGEFKENGKILPQDTLKKHIVEDLVQASELKNFEDALKIKELSANVTLKAGDVTKTDKYTVKFVKAEENQNPAEENKDLKKTSMDIRTKLMSTSADGTGVQAIWVKLDGLYLKDENGKVVPVKADEIKKYIKSIEISSGENTFTIPEKDVIYVSGNEFNPDADVEFKDTDKDSIIVKVKFGDYNKSFKGSEKIKISFGEDKNTHAKLLDDGLSIIADYAVSSF